MIVLALVLFCESQILTQTIAISDLGDALTIQGFKASMMLLKICISLMMLLIMSEVTEEFVCSRM